MYPYIHFGSHTLYSFGVACGLGITLSLLAFARYFKAHHIDINWMILSAGLLLSFGIFGARLLYSITETRQLAGSKINGGYSYLGGLLIFLVTGTLMILLRRLPLLPILDSLFCVSFGYALARVGCFLAGDGDYGAPTNRWWGISFPHGLVPTVQRVQPTMLFVAGWELLLFAAFWHTVTHTHITTRRPGVLFGLYLIATSLGRYWIEYLSLNRPILLGLTAAQCVSLLLIIVGVTAIVSTWSKQNTIQLL